MLLKTLTREEVIELIADAIASTLPEEAQGSLLLDFNEEGGVDVFFVEKSDTVPN